MINEIVELKKFAKQLKDSNAFEKLEEYIKKMQNLSYALRDKMDENSQYKKEIEDKIKETNEIEQEMNNFLKLSYKYENYCDTAGVICEIFKWCYSPVPKYENMIKEKNTKNYFKMVNVVYNNTLKNLKMKKQKYDRSLDIIENF